MARKFLLNVIIALNFYFGIWSLPTEAMIFFGHPDVPALYMKLRLDFRDQDTFLLYDYYQRKIACDLLLTANIYSLPGPLSGTRESHESLRIMKNYQEIGHNRGYPEEMLRYNKWNMFFDSQIIPVNVFPCVGNEVDEVIIFLTNGFKPFRKRMFVLVMKPFLSPLQMVAVLEDNPLFHIDLSAPHYLDHRFQASVKADVGTSGSRELLETSLTLGSVASVPVDEGFHISSTFQHFRICCSVANEVSTVFDLDIKTYNFVYPMVGIREQTKAILDKNDKLMLYTKVLPCSVNFEWTRPKFYLMRDRHERMSVFVFRPIQNETFGEALKLEGIVDQVLALLDT